MTNKLNTAAELAAEITYFNENYSKAPSVPATEEAVNQLFAYVSDLPRSIDEDEEYVLLDFNVEHLPMNVEQCFGQQDLVSAFLSCLRFNPFATVEMTDGVINPIIASISASGGDGMSGASVGWVDGALMKHIVRRFLAKFEQDDETEAKARSARQGIMSYIGIGLKERRNLLINKTTDPADRARVSTLIPNLPRIFGPDRDDEDKIIEAANRIIKKRASTDAIFF